MRRFWQLTRFFMKRMLLSKLYLGSMIFFIITFTSRFVIRANEAYGMSDYGNLLGEMFIIIQVLMLFHLVYFYKLFSDELKYGVQTFFVDSYQILLQKISAIVVVHITIQWLFFQGQFVLYVLFNRLWGIVDSSFYLDAWMFMIIYFVLPLIVSMLIGLIIAFVFGKHKISFAAIFLSWILIGPLTTEIFTGFFRTIPADGIQTLFFLGVQNMTHVYTDYIGFNFTSANALKVFVWIMIGFAILLLLTLRYVRVQRDKMMVISIIVCFFLLGIVFVPLIKTTKYYSYEDRELASMYYKKLPEAQPDLRYDIERYDMELINNTNVSVIVNVYFKELQTNTPTFQLYHAVEELKVTTKEGKNVPFTQIGDQLQLHLEHPSSLRFTYRLIDTALLPVRNGSMMLPGSLSWYPRKMEGHIFQFESEGAPLQQPIRHVEHDDIKLTTTGYKSIVTNLKEVKVNQYENYTGGVLFISGQFEVLEVGQKSVVIPSDWNNNHEPVINFFDVSESVFSEMEHILSLDVQSIPGLVIFQSPLHASYMDETNWLYHTDSLYPIDKIATLYELPYQLVETFIVNQVKNHSPKMYSEWQSLMGLTLQLRCNLQLGGFFLESSYPSSYDYELTPSEQKRLEEVYASYFNLSEEKQNSFLKNWYEKIEIIQNDWEQIILLMDEVKKDAG